MFCIRIYWRQGMERAQVTRCENHWVTSQRAIRCTYSLENDIEIMYTYRADKWWITTCPRIVCPDSHSLVPATSFFYGTRLGRHAFRNVIYRRNIVRHSSYYVICTRYVIWQILCKMCPFSIELHSSFSVISFDLHVVEKYNADCTLELTFAF